MPKRDVTLCPWTNRKITIAKIGEHFMAVSPHGWMSPPQLTEKDVIEWLSWWKGKDPRPDITVKHYDGPVLGSAKDLAKREGKVL